MNCHTLRIQNETRACYSFVEDMPVKWMDSLVALTLCSSLSTNSSLFFHWGGRLEHFSVTGRYAEYSGYKCWEVSRGGTEPCWVEVEFTRSFFFFLSFPSSPSGECQPSEVNSACSESKTFAEVVLQTVQRNSLWQKDARENVWLGIFTVTSFSFVALPRPLWDVWMLYFSM